MQPRIDKCRWQGAGGGDWGVEGGSRFVEDAQEKALLWQNRDVPLVNIKTIRIAQFINQFVSNRTIPDGKVC